MADVETTLRTLRETIPMRSKASEVQPGIPRTFQALAEAWHRGDDADLAPVTLEDALQISAVMVCLDVLSQDIAKTPMHLYERLENGGKRKVSPREHWMAAMLADQPNSDHTWIEFFEMVMLHLGLLQNAFVAKRVRNNGEVEEMVPVLPWRVRLLALPDYTGWAYDLQKVTVGEKVLLRNFSNRLREEEMVHFRGRMFDGLLGYSNLLAGAKTLGLAREIGDYQSRLYRNDAAVRGLFQQRPNENTEGLQETALKNLRRQLAEGMASMRRGALPLILEAGFEFKQVNMNADQAEVSKAWNQALENTARQFRMPPHKIMHLAAVKYENLAQLEASYVFDTLIPYAERIEQRMAHSLLNRDERARYFLQFDRERMVLSDPEKQAEMIRVLAAHGAITVDEMRERGYLNPLSGEQGKVRLINKGFHRIDANGEIMPEPEAAGGQTTATGDTPDAPTNEGGDPNKSVVDFIPLRVI